VKALGQFDAVYEKSFVDLVLMLRRKGGSDQEIRQVIETQIAQWKAARAAF
jgi:hypothetical protein